jgi:hypothetical protein
MTIGGSMNRISATLLSLAVCILTGLPLITYATSYPILEHPPQVIHGEVLLDVGTIVYLFHSGMPDVKTTTFAGEVLPAHRESPCCSVSECGKVKILSYIGNNYIKAVVTEGALRPGDIVKKGAVSYLVTLFGCDCARVY